MVIFLKIQSLNLDVKSVVEQKTLLARQSGFSLIEIMVSALVLSLSLLGVLGMQMTGMKGTHHSFMKQQAMGVVQNLMERMSSNRDGVTAGDYVFDSNTATPNCATAVPDCQSTDCSSSEIALVDKLNLVCGYREAGSSLRTGGIKFIGPDDIVALVGGRLKVDCRPVGNCASGDITVRVEWDERALGDEIVQRDSLVLNWRIGAK